MWVLPGSVCPGMVRGTDPRSLGSSPVRSSVGFFVERASSGFTPLPRLGGARHWVVPAVGPWVASQDPPDDHRRRPEHSVHLQGSQTVGGTARLILADVSVKRRDEGTPAFDEANGQPREGTNPPQRAPHATAVIRSPCRYRCSHHRSFRSAWCHAPSRSFATRPGSVAAVGRARTTTTVPSASSSTRGRHRCRRRRFTRLRVTALPTVLETTKPTRGASSDREVIGPSDADRPPVPQLSTVAVDNSVMSVGSG